MKQTGFKRIYVAEMVIGICALVYYFLCVFSGVSARSILFVWLIGGAALLIKSLFVLYRLKTGGLQRHVRVAANVFSVLFLAWAVCVCSFSTLAIIKMYQPQTQGLDCILILGARVNSDGTPSDALNSRVETAFDYLSKNPETVALATGGQGAGEGMSEGACIKLELIKKGISSERILTEEQSSTTVENMKFSSMLLPEHIKTVGVVTNNFHVLRSVITARCYMHQEIYGISAPFSGILLPHYMLREWITFVVELFRGNIF